MKRTYEEILDRGGPANVDLHAATERAVKRIKIVHEEVESVSAARALKAARYVYFIGFGSDDRNLEKLVIPASIGQANFH